MQKYGKKIGASAKKCKIFFGHSTKQIKHISATHKEN